MKKLNQHLTLLLFALLAMITTIPSQAQIFQSSTSKTTLIELYTSEGCSSCPPADKWISRLKDKDGLWTQFIPIAFHVDYWDWIGWKDDFAKPEYGARQKRYKSLRKARSVYTPGFFVNGHEWKAFFNNKDALPTFKNGPTGILKAERIGNILNISFKPVNSPMRKKDLTINAAVLDFSKSHFIKWGENIGKTLHHDFIAHELVSTVAELHNGKFKAQLKLSTPFNLDTEQAIVVWVSDNKNEDVLQATGGWILAEKD